MTTERPRVAVREWLEPVGTRKHAFPLGGGIATGAASAPRECVSSWRAPHLVLVHGNGHADGHAETYLDAARPVRWYADAATAILAGERPIAVTEALAAAAAALPDQVRSEDERLSRERGTSHEAASFQLAGTFLEALVARFDTDRGRVEVAVVGDIGAMRWRGGAVDVVHRGGTVGEDADPAEPPVSPLIASLLASGIRPLEGTLVGRVRELAYDQVSGDRWLFTTRGLHRAVTHEALAQAFSGGAAGLDRLLRDLARGAAGTHWPFAVELTFGG